MTRILRATMAAVLALWPTLAAAKTVEQDVDVSLRQRIIHTLRGPANPLPEKYGEKPNGLFLERYKMDFDNGKYDMEFEAENVGLNNESFRFEGGEPGKFTWNGGWDKTPHLFSNEARTLYQDMGDGNMVLVGGQNLRNMSDANFNLYVTTTVGQGRYIPLGFMTETGKLDLRFRPAEDFTVKVGALHMTRNGTKPTSASFGFSNAIEIAAPVNQVTNEAYLDMQVAKKDYQIGFNYRLSKFENNIPTLRWDNPKRSSDQMVGTTGKVDNSGYSAGDRAAQGAQAMEPSNQAHALKVEGGVSLPLESRFSFEAGYQRWSALNAMMPYTTNSSITATNVALNKYLTNDPTGPVGGALKNQYIIANNAIPCDTTLVSCLPDVNIDTKYEIFTYMGKLSSRPLPGLRASLSHDSYIAENKSKIYDLIGFGVFDGKWEPEELKTKRESFRDDKTALKFDYEITSWLSGNLGLSHAYMKKTREISKSREDEGTVGLTFRPSRDLFVNTSVLMSGRRGNGMDYQDYTTATASKTVAAAQVNYTLFTTDPGLRRADVADRNRNSARVQVQWTPGEASYSLSARMTEDRYRLGKGDPTAGDPTVYPELLGMYQARDESVGTDMSIPLPLGMTLDAYYEFDFNSRNVRGNASSSNASENCQINVATSKLNPGCSSTTYTFQDPNRRWDTRITENSHIAGISLSAMPLEKLKTVFGYDIVSTRGNSDPISQGDCLNDNSLPKCWPTGTTIAGGKEAGTYLPLPTTRRMNQTFKAGARYDVLKDLTLTANYQFDKFDIDDYGYENVPLRNSNDAIFLGASLRNYYSHMLALGMNYRF